MESRVIYFYDQPSDSVLPQHVDLNNYYLSPFQHENLTYLTVEHYYQSHKYSPSSAPFETVRTTPTPNQAKKLTREFPYDKDWWERTKDSVMAQALRLKYDQCPELRERLLMTWECDLREDSLRDPYWGGRLPGSKNRLGELLIEERERRRNGLDKVPVPALAWLTRPVHAIFPAPVPTRVQALETLLQQLPCDSLEAALAQHPILSQLSPESVQTLVSSEASYLTIPEDSQQVSIFPLIYVLSGTGEMMTSGRFPIKPGMWISRSSAGVYITTDSELKVAELKVDRTMSLLAQNASREHLCLRAICGSMDHFQPFKFKIAAIESGQTVTVSELITALSKSWTHFVTPDTVLDSLLSLPVTAATVSQYHLRLNPLQTFISYSQLSAHSMEVHLPPTELEKLCFHLAVFADLRKLIHTETVNANIVEVMQKNAPEQFEQIMQSEGNEITVNTEICREEWKNVLNSFDISSVDVIFGDLNVIKTCFSPYLQLISQKSHEFTAVNYQSPSPKPLSFSVKYYTLVNPEQMYRATEFDANFGVKYVSFCGQEGILVTPEGRNCLGLGGSAQYVLCLERQGGAATARVLREVRSVVRSVRVVEKWRHRVESTSIGSFRNEGNTVQCMTDGLVACVPDKVGYLTDPTTTKCMEALPHDTVISHLSAPIFQEICEITRAQPVEIIGFVPHSESQELDYLEGLKAVEITESVVMVLYGPATEELPGLYEAAYSAITKKKAVFEVVTFASAFPYDVTEVSLGKVIEDAQIFYRRKSDHRAVVWSPSQLQYLLRKTPAASKVLVFSATPVPSSLYQDCTASVTKYTVNEDAESVDSVVFTYASGQWLRRDTQVALETCLAGSLG